MATLTDKLGTSSFNLSFYEGEGLALGHEDDLNNWIPVTFETRLHEEAYAVDPEVGAAINLREIRELFTKLQELIRGRRAANTFRKVGIFAFEFFYDLEFAYLEEEDEIRLLIWTVEAVRVDGEIQGINRGIRLYATFESFRAFVRELEAELLPILSVHGMKLEPLDVEKESEQSRERRIAVIRQLAAAGDSSRNAALLSELADEDDPLVRGELALALSELREEKAVDVIVELVQQRKTLGYRGTLLYALEPLDYARHKQVLIEQLIGGNYEVSAQAYTLLKQIQASFTESERQMYRAKLADKLDMLNKAASLFE